MNEAAASDSHGNVTIIEADGRTFHVIGTAHISRESVNEVREVIERVRPDTVCIELCEPRYQALTDESQWSKLDIFQVIREGKTLFLLANLAIGAYQRRLGAQLGVKPGAELLEAAKAAEDVGAKIELVDRSIHTTLKRAWANVPFFRKIGLMSAIVESLIGGGSDGKEVDEAEIEHLKEQANLSEMMKEFSQALPQVKEPLIDERDLYMSARCRQAEGETIVAVVGAGHVPGMKAHFHDDIDLDQLDVIPPKAWWIQPLKWLLPAVIIGAFVYGYLQQGTQTFEQMLYAWILPNSVFAALMTIVALGHPLTVLVAFLGSPLTSLNPLLPIGILTGYTEAKLRKPTVEDAQRINDDVQSLKGFYQNKFTRVLLVTFLSIIGSAMGAWVGAPLVLRLAGGG